MTIERNVSATEAAKNFGAIITEVRESGAAYVVERRGRPVASIRPLEASTCTFERFVELVRNWPGPMVDEEYLRAVEEGIEEANRPAIPEVGWAS